MGVSEILQLDRIGRCRRIHQAITASALTTFRKDFPEKILKRTWPRDEGARQLLSKATVPLPVVQCTFVNRAGSCQKDRHCRRLPTGHAGAFPDRALALALRLLSTGGCDDGDNDEAGHQKPHAGANPKSVQHRQKQHEEERRAPQARDIGLASGN
jgi:hypothetical protein